MIESLLSAIATLFIQYLNLASLLSSYILYKDVNMMLYAKLIRLAPTMLCIHLVISPDLYVRGVNDAMPT